MKKHLTAIFIATLIFCMAVSPAWAAEQQPLPISVFINGAQLEFSALPVIENGKTLVPLRAIFEALGATVSWDDATRTVTAVKGADTIIIGIDNPVMLKNGAEITLDVPARLINGSTLVPVRAVSEGLGATVEWNGELRQVLIFTATLSEVLENAYQFTQLSDVDMQALKESYHDIRYAFEQVVLPATVFSANAEIAKLINQKSSVEEDFAKDIWNILVASRISYLQEISTDAYVINAAEIETEEQFIEALRPLIKEAGMEADNYFKVSFETLADKSTLMLLTFNDTDGYLACQYIGVAVSGQDTVRYFTAEADPFKTDNLFFCEITPAARNTLALISFEKKDFIQAVEMALAAD